MIRDKNRSLFAALAMFAMAAPTFAVAANEPKPLLSTPVVSPARGQFVQPLGATVLYDQSGLGIQTIVAQDFADVPTFSSQLADDFTITDSSGWTILSVVIQEDTSQATDIAGVLFNVDIFADDGGVPAAQAECDYLDLPAAFDATNTVATIALDQTCFLAPGTYWLSATPDQPFDTGGQFYASLGDTGSRFGAIPVWQNPGGAFGGVCTSWTPLNTCADLSANGFTATDAMLFQVIGHTGGQPGHISLSIGLAEDNGDMAQCGTSTNLSATVGDQINFCYTVVNNSPLELDFQSLVDTVDGVILSYVPIAIEPGASYQYNRIVTATASQTSTSTWSSNDIQPGYTDSAGTYDFVDITSSGTALDLIFDAGASVTVPFSFTFGDSSSNVLCVANEGIILFGVSAGCINDNYNFPLPYSGLSAPAIIPFWDVFMSAGNVYYATIGVSPNRQFIVEYYNKDTYDDQNVSPGYTFEVILNESDGSIDFNYANVSVPTDPLHTNGIGGSVGLQLSPTLANIFSENTASLSNGQNIHWVTAPPPIVFSDSKRVSLDVGAPVIYVVPGPVSDTAEVGTAVTSPLYLLNSGNRNLNWTLLEAPGDSRLPPVPAYSIPNYKRGIVQTGLPRRSARATASKSRPSAPFGDGTVPAFGMAYYDTGNQYVRLDAAAPTNLTTVAAVTDAFYAGTFVNFDFSKEYLVDAVTGDLSTIDTADGAQHLIGNTGLAASEVASAIKWDVTSGNTYLMSTSCGTSATISNLYTLDISTGATSLVGSDVGTQTCIVAIAIDPGSGQLYGLDISLGLLYSIDKSNGQVTGAGFVGLDLNFAQGMDFDARTGILYLAGYDGTTGNMYTIDPDSGSATLISPIGSGVEMAAFAIATKTPPCTRPGDIPWLSESATTGTTTPGLYSTVDITMDASTLSAGSYSATLCIHSNDLLHPLAVVPVDFTVTSNGTTDVIFADGFDGR